MQKILRYVYDIVLFTTNSCFSFIEAVNLEQTLTVPYSLISNPTTHILAGLGAAGFPLTVCRHFGEFYKA